MPTLDDLWTAIMADFEPTLTPVSFDTWIKSSKPVSLNDGVLTLQVPSQMHKDHWVSSKIGQQLVEFAFKESNTDITPRFVLEQDMVQQQTVPTAGYNANNTPTFLRETKLNPKYTFDTFVIGKGNQMAHAAALAVSEEPGTQYNPLFLYGGVGLGKTHLMHAIGNNMIANNPNTRVKYVSSEAFTNDFINAIQTKTQEQFRQEYRNVDLLLVDDIQFFADKEGTQEEFFHTFNALYNDSKQIVLTSDREPKEIPKLQDRLVSRFAWGLPTDITPPDLETRIAILRNKADADHINIPNDTLSYIAGQIDSNVRELEGAMARVQAFAKLKNEPITTDLVAESLKSLNLTSKINELSIAMIQDKVAQYYNISLADLKGKKRNKDIVMPRQVAMYLTRELTDSSLPKIGNEFGGRDHTTVIHSYDKITEALTKDSGLERQISDLKGELQS